MGFNKYLEDVLPQEAKALYEGEQVRTIKFKNFNEFMDFVMGGDAGISLELSGKKDGKKVFMKLNGKNLSEVIQKYDDYFDAPMEEEQKAFVVQSIMKEAMKQIKEQNFNITGPVTVNADINEPEGSEENKEVPQQPESGEEEQPVQAMQKEKRDTAEQQEF